MSPEAEKLFQNHIAEFLNKQHGYAVLEQPEITDREYYLAEDHLMAFIRATQPETLARLEGDYGSDASMEIIRALKEQVEKAPLWVILRNGLTVRGHHFSLYGPKPRSGESAANRYYAENRITYKCELVIDEAKRPDIVLFLNGLPTIVIELKHEASKQNVHDAVVQFNQRNHADRIFQLPFLYIAADTSDVKVATDPRREQNFRWYNTGLENQPITEGEYPVEYLYREVLAQDSVLEAISFYLVYVPKQEAADDKPERPAFSIFPRYHQARMVRRVADDVLRHFNSNGNLGKKYLINHSAGSGKTLSISWLADRLHSLYKPGGDEKAVEMVFILTDRKSLDKNVRDELINFCHLRGVIKFAKKSQQLAQFIQKRESIIVTTQQKFVRILEVRTVRNKLALLSGQQQAKAWSGELCAQWMGADPEQAAVLYVDGHVRVYHGHQTKLPRHYVARQKLCLRATTDYWVNALDGQPFFLLNQAVDPGLLQVLEHEIVPRLERKIPNQPTPEQLAEDASLHRFTLVFDREGYSPAFVQRLEEKTHCLSDLPQIPRRGLVAGGVLSLSGDACIGRLCGNALGRARHLPGE